MPFRSTLTSFFGEEVSQVICIIGIVFSSTFLLLLWGLYDILLVSNQVTIEDTIL